MSGPEMVLARLGSRLLLATCHVPDPDGATVRATAISRAVGGEVAAKGSTCMAAQDANGRPGCGVVKDDLVAAGQRQQAAVRALSRPVGDAPSRQPERTVAKQANQFGRPNPADMGKRPGW